MLSLLQQANKKPPAKITDSREESSLSDDSFVSIESEDLDRPMNSQEIADTRAEIQQKINEDVTTVKRESEDHDDLLGQMLQSVVDNIVPDEP